MPAVSKIALLPTDVQVRLCAFLREHQYGHIEEATEWLRNLGHDIGKSAVGAFALKLKKGQELHELRQATIAVRQECLRVASTVAAPENVLSVAQTYVDWVQGAHEL